MNIDWCVGKLTDEQKDYCLKRQNQVYTEKRELDRKIFALNKALENLKDNINNEVNIAIVDELMAIDVLLAEQLDIMSKYSDVLCKRINQLETKIQSE